MLARPRMYLAAKRVRIASHDALHPLRVIMQIWSERELRIVAAAWRTTRRPGVRLAALSISWLGNGAIYVILALPLYAASGWAWRPLAEAGIAMGIAHLVYPWLKAACARSRPCKLQDSLEPLLASLDEHSFPSGHAMTLSAAAVPIVAAMPAMWPLALGSWLAMAWARVASAHHYPSDIVAGGLLGVGIALPVTFLF